VLAAEEQVGVSPPVSFSQARARVLDRPSDSRVGVRQVRVSGVFEFGERAEPGDLVDGDLYRP
jgi:hypothetical protein